MNKLDIRTLLYTTFWGVAIIGIIFSPLPPLSNQNQQASAVSFLSPFGGKVTFIINCTCVVSGDLARQKKLVYIGQPKGGTFTKDLTTRVYMNHAVSVGNWVLGLAGMSQTCQVQVGKFCVNVGSGKLMTKVGTSGATGLGF